MRLPYLTGVVALACVLAAGCSGSQGGGDLKNSSAVATTTVLLPKSYKFEPAVIKIKRGDTVTWKNEDNFTHDVTMLSGDDTSHHTIKRGDRVKLTFDKPGTYKYVCNFHEHDMHGKVIVT
jgi:plastocyanin